MSTPVSHTLDADGFDESLFTGGVDESDIPDELDSPDDLDAAIEAAEAAVFEQVTAGMHDVHDVQQALELDRGDDALLMRDLLALAIEDSQRRLHETAADELVSTSQTLEQLRQTDEHVAVEAFATSVTSILREDVAAINARRKGSKKRAPLPAVTSLTPPQVAQVMVSLWHVIRVRRATVTTESERGLELALYEDREGADRQGLYLTDPQALHERMAMIRPHLSERDSREVIETLRTLAPVRQLHSDPDLIPVANGVLHYRTKDLSEYTPEQVFLTRSPVAWTPHAPEPTITMPDGQVWTPSGWMQELTSTAEGELRPELERLLYQVIGAALRPGVRWDKAIFPYSEVGANGKGSYCTLLRGLVGEGAASIPIETFSSDFGLMGLLRASAVIVDENDVGMYVDRAAAFKAAVTGDSFFVNRKNIAPVEMTFRGLMVQCINELPRFRDKSGSLLRRFLLIPFEQSFARHGVERRYIKSDYLRRRDVLEWLMWRALGELDVYDELDEPAACRALLGEYQQSNDPLREFWEEHVSRMRGFLPWGLLYEIYRGWLIQSQPSAKVMSARAFSHALGIIARGEGWLLSEPRRVTHAQAQAQSLALVTESGDALRLLRRGRSDEPTPALQWLGLQNAPGASPELVTGRAWTERVLRGLMSSEDALDEVVAAAQAAERQPVDPAPTAATPPQVLTEPQIDRLTGRRPGHAHQERESVSVALTVLDRARSKTPDPLL